MLRGVVIPLMLVFLGVGCGGPAGTARERVGDTTGDGGDSLSAAETDQHSEVTPESSAKTKTASLPQLTAVQKKRIGARLQHLISRPDVGAKDTEQSPSSASGYEVIIQCDDIDKLREAGIPLRSVQGDIVTARLTVKDILEATMVEDVEAIRAATQYRQMTEPEAGMSNPRPGGGRHQ
mgnify:CR=1 FL=1